MLIKLNNSVFVQIPASEVLFLQGVVLFVVYLRQDVVFPPRLFVSEQNYTKTTEQVSGDLVEGCGLSPGRTRKNMLVLIQEFLFSFLQCSNLGSFIDVLTDF